MPRPVFGTSLFLPWVQGALAQAKATTMTFLSTLGIVLVIVGGGITVLFWVPQIVNRPKLKEMLGQRYPMLFFVYVANGPLLLFVGLFLLLRF